MAFVQAQITKVDNGYVVGVVDYDILSGKQGQTQYIAEDIKQVINMNKIPYLFSLPTIANVT